MRKQKTEGEKTLILAQCFLYYCFFISPSVSYADSSLVRGSQSLCRGPVPYELYATYVKIHKIIAPKYYVVKNKALKTDKTISTINYSE